MQLGLSSIAWHLRWDPLLDYLKDCAAKWDGNRRSLLDYVEFEHPTSAQAAMKAWMTGAVARAYRPGVKFDHMIILYGPQGVDKSGLLSVLGGEFFGDRVPFDMPIDEWVEATLGKWILESAELEAFSSVKDAARLKHRVTAQDDACRLKHTKDKHKRYPRRFVLAGRRTSGACCRTTGARRFWVLEVKAVDFAGLKDNVGHLWGQYVHDQDYLKDSALRLSHEDARLLAQAAERFRDRSPIEEAVSLFDAPVQQGWIESRDLNKWIGGQLESALSPRGQYTYRQVNASMEMQGWSLAQRQVPREEHADLVRANVWIKRETAR